MFAASITLARALRIPRVPGPEKPSMPKPLSLLQVCITLALAAPFVAAQSPQPFQNRPDAPQPYPNLAQNITDQSLAHHPDVLVVAFHAVIPGEPINRVIAINRAQSDKFQWRPSDDIDTDTAKSSKTIVQVIPATHRMEVHMPLHNRDGLTIATFVCVWNFKDEHQAPDLIRKSQLIRDEIAPQITTVAQLLSPP
jgi:hypothetical protein